MLQVFNNYNSMRRRTEHRSKRQNNELQVFPIWTIALLTLTILILGRDGFCSALSPSVSRQSTSTRHHRTRFESVNGLPPSGDVASSPLFASNTRRTQLHRLRTRNPNTGSSPSALHMVLTTPESIIEQASTVTLLDDLIDESVRTSARKPIMMQFDPSSGWVSSASIF
jgi:hypothetical protein